MPVRIAPQYFLLGHQPAEVVSPDSQRLRKPRYCTSKPSADSARCSTVQRIVDTATVQRRERAGKCSRTTQYASRLSEHPPFQIRSGLSRSILVSPSAPAVVDRVCAVLAFHRSGDWEPVCGRGELDVMSACAMTDGGRPRGGSLRPGNQPGHAAEAGSDLGLDRDEDRNHQRREHQKGE